MTIPSVIRSVLATDCGSTTTKAILIEKVDGHYRQTFRGEAPTTVEEPVAEVAIETIVVIERFLNVLGRRDRGLDRGAEHETQVVENAEIEGVHRGDPLIDPDAAKTDAETIPWRRRELG